MFHACKKTHKEKSLFTSFKAEFLSIASLIWMDSNNWEDPKRDKFTFKLKISTSKSIIYNFVIIVKILKHLETWDWILHFVFDNSKRDAFNF